MITALNIPEWRAMSGIGLTCTRAVLSGGAYTAVRPDRGQWARPSIAAASSSSGVPDMITYRGPAAPSSPPDRCGGPTALAQPACRCRRQRFDGGFYPDCWWRVRVMGRQPSPPSVAKRYWTQSRASGSQAKRHNWTGPSLAPA